MVFKRMYVKYLSLLLLFVITSCIEEYDFSNESYKDTLVVEATITDEFKFQEIHLSRAHQFGDKPIAEISAKVKVLDSNSNIYTFSEQDSGRYVSNVQFAAKPDISYKLELVTSDGEEVVSSDVKLQGSKAMDNVYAEVTTDTSTGDLGIGIFVDTNDPTGNSQFFRYDFTETDKVILPYWVSDSLKVVSRVTRETPVPVFEVVRKNYKDRICYRTKKATEIIQTDLSNLKTNKVDKFRVRFINANDYKTIYRYSILVKQYVQSYQSYTYYKTLSKFSSEGSVLSQVQTGFINGNLSYISSSDKKVIGFFDVSGYSEKRIFFKFKDFFPDKPYPKFDFYCEITAPVVIKPGGRSPLLDAIDNGIFIYYDINENPKPREGPYLLVRRECNDCRVYGTIEKPDFWVD